MAVGTPQPGAFEIDVELDESATTIDDGQGNTVAAFLQEYVHGGLPAHVFFADLNTKALHHIGADLAAKGLVTPEELGVRVEAEVSDLHHLGVDVRRGGDPEIVATKVRQLIAELFPHS